MVFFGNSFPSFPSKNFRKILQLVFCFKRLKKYQLIKIFDFLISMSFYLNQSNYLSILLFIDFMIIHFINFLIF